MKWARNLLRMCKRQLYTKFSYENLKEEGNIEDIGIECVRALLTILMFYLDAGLLASSQYPEGPATGHLGTGFFLGFPVSNSKC
jgi:hypothetical protein